MKSVHLWAAAVAVSVAGLIVVLGTLTAVSLENAYVHSLVAKPLPQRTAGSALQRAAFRHADLLPVYGSSEIVLGTSPYNAPTMFGNYATGFDVFEVANDFAHSLIMAERLAAIGSDLKGKKVVISFTPWAFTLNTLPTGAYASDFSRLHANEMIFSTRLSTITKRAAAKRMLQYPDTLRDDPILRLAVDTLVAESSPLGDAQYWAIWPLGKLQVIVIQLQDHWETANYILAHRNELKPTTPRPSQQIDWQAWLERARKEQEQNANNNPYGIQNDSWSGWYKGIVKDKVLKTTDQKYLEELNGSTEWTDLDILLQVLKELGAEPLLISRPINGAFWGAMGVSKEARRVYYDRLHQMTGAYGVQVIDFAEHEDDKYFSADPLEHSSRLGWIYVDQALDAFYHQNR